MHPSFVQEIDSCIYYSVVDLVQVPDTFLEKKEKQQL